MDIEKLKKYPEFLDMNQVKDLLGLQTSTQAYALLKKKSVKVKRIGHSVMVAKCDLEDAFGANG